MAESLTITLPGAPRTKKNSANIQMAGKRKIVKPSEAWLAWRDRVQAWLWKQPLVFRRSFPLPTADYNIAAIFYRDALRGDAVGYYQGVADVLEDVGILTNDEQLVQWDGSRLSIDRDLPRVELTLTPIGE